MLLSFARTKTCRPWFVIPAALAHCTILRPASWPANSRQIVLTFDDGPDSQGVTGAILDVLAKNEVHAAFCVVGSHVESSPAIVRRIAADGHHIVNHTQSHARPLFSPSRLDGDIIAADRSIAAALHEPAFKTHWFRPPYGLITPSVALSSEARARRIAHLTFYIDDSAIEPDRGRHFVETLQGAIERHKGGAIVLHERQFPDRRPEKIDKSWLPAELDRLIKWAREKGYTFAQYQ